MLLTDARRPAGTRAGGELACSSATLPTRNGDVESDARSFDVPYVKRPTIDSTADKPHTKEFFFVRSAHADDWSGVRRVATLDGSFVTHADLARISDKPWNDMVVDGQGNTYIGNIGFDFPGGEFRPGVVAQVSADGFARQVTAQTAFANGMVVTPDAARTGLVLMTPAPAPHAGWP